jgi:hypothetical protein
MIQSEGKKGGFRLMRAQPLAVALCALLAHAAPAPPRIEVTEGDGAINNIRLHRAKEPVVRMVDASGKPIPNVAVTFLLPERGPGGTFADGLTSLTVMTDDNGVAVGRGLHPNRTAGQFQIRVTAAYQGQTVTANVTQTNAEPAPGGGGSSKKILILALIGGGAAAGAAVALGAKHGSSSSPAANPGVVITPGSPSFGPPK